jgi:formylglycine-generating enzyme required for sulfatase activity
MTDFEIYFPEVSYSFPMIFVKGTGDTTYLFGEQEKVSVRITDFYISKYPVTQMLWEHITGSNPSRFNGQNKPVEFVSFNDITINNAFLDKLNSANGSRYKLHNNFVFRLPSETEWEYAARGGTHWTDGFQFSGSNDLDTVGWFEQNSGKITDLTLLHQLKNQKKGTETHNVGQKSPNQLNIFDMCGNVWEWCQDYYQPDIHKIPKDGAPYLGETNERVLRGGCHHNWAIHCTVSKRYEIIPEAKDECIGFRIAASIVT